MTINTTSVSTGPYAGTNSTDTFIYDFKIQLSSEIVVVETDAAGVYSVLVEGSDFSVTGVGVNGGGNVIRSAGNLPSGYEWLISRVTAQTQESDFPAQGAFTPESHEDAFDKVTQILQELDDKNVNLPAGSRAGNIYSFDNTGQSEANIDADAVRALIAGALATGVLMTVDDFTGDGSTVAFIMSISPPSVNSILATIDGVMQLPTTDFTVSGATVTFNTAPPDQTSVVLRNIGNTAPSLSVDSTNVTHTPSETGGVQRNVQLALSDRLSVKDFGAKGDAVNDDTTVIQAAIDAAASAGGGNVYLPHGIYNISAKLVIPANVRMEGESEATIIDNINAVGGDAVEVDNPVYQYGGIANLTIRGNASSGDGLVLNGVTSGHYTTSFRNIRLVDHGGNGLVLSGAVYYCTFDQIYCRDNVGHGVYIHDGGGAFRPNANTFLNINCINNGGSGVYLEKGNGNVFLGGSMQGSTVHGFFIDTADSTVIFGTWLEGNTTSGITTTANSRGSIITPGKTLDIVDVFRGTTIYNSPAVVETDSSWSPNVLGQSITPHLIGNLYNGLGNTMVIPAVHMTLGGGAVLEADDRALLGYRVKIDSTSENAYIGLFEVKAPAWIRNGKYRIFAIMRSDAGTGTVQLQVLNNDDVVNLVLATITPKISATEYTVANPGGEYFEVGETDYNDSIRFRLFKIDNTDTAYISHIVVVPVDNISGAEFVAFTLADATPSVAGRKNFETSDTTTYTDFDDGVDGQEITLLALHAATVTDGTNIFTSTGANKVLTVDIAYRFVNRGGNWYEIATA